MKNTGKTLSILLIMAVMFIAGLPNSAAYAAGEDSSAIDFTVTEQITMSNGPGCSLTSESLEITHNGSKGFLSIDSISAAAVSGWDLVESTVDFTVMDKDQKDFSLTIADSHDLISPYTEKEELSAGKTASKTISGKTGASSISVNEKIADITVAVSYIPEYTITFDGYGGTAIDPITARGDKAIGELPEPTRAGCTFAGWFTETEGGVEITKDTIPTADDTYYARWESSFAIYSEDDDSLLFYNREGVPKVGDTYNGKTVTSLYTDVEATAAASAEEIPWYEHIPDISKAGFVDKLLPINTSFWFSGCANCTEIDLANLDTQKTTKMTAMFSDCTSIKSLDVSKFNTENVTHFNSVFSHCKLLEALDVSNWDTSKATTMRYLFSNCYELDSLDVSNFVTTNVVDMGYMFNGCTNIATLDLDGFDTSKVGLMEYMFYKLGYNVEAFDISGIEGWDVSSVKTLNNTFAFSGHDANTYNIGDLSGWKTDSLTSLYHTFESAGYNCDVFNIGNIGSWNTSKVTTMSTAFANSGYYAKDWYIGDLSGWNTSKVTVMHVMFNAAGYSCENFNVGDLGKWDTSNVSAIYSMFVHSGYNAKTWYIGDLSNWNTSKLTGTIQHLFANAGHSAKVWSVGDLSTKTVTRPDGSTYTAWDLSGVNNMQSVFDNAGYSATEFNIGDIGTWNTSKVTNMCCMFNHAGHSASYWYIGDLNAWDTSKVTDMWCLFTSTPAKELNLTNWNTSNVTYYLSDEGNHHGMFGMFAGMRYLEKITFGEKFNFTGDGTCTGDYVAVLPTPDEAYIPGVTGLWYDVDTDIGYTPEDVPNTTAATYTVFPPKGAYAAVYGGNTLIFGKGEVPQTYTSDAGSTLSLTKSWTEDDGVDLEGYNWGEEMTSLSQIPWYSYKSSITSVDVVDTIKPISMAYWFLNMPNCKTIDLSLMDGTATVDLISTFHNCTSLKSVTLSDGFASNAKEFYCAFNRCTSLENLTLPEGFGSKATAMSHTFYKCSTIKELELPTGFGVYAESIDGLFGEMTLLESISLPEGFGAEATNIEITFINCTSLESISLPEGFGQKADNMYQTFSGLGVKEIILPAGCGQVATNMQGMFLICDNLETAVLGEGFGSNATDVSQMFANDQNLKRLVIPDGFGTKATTLQYMLYDTVRLEEITLPENFSFKGSASSGYYADLPIPSSYYIPLADGNWYDAAGNFYDNLDGDYDGSTMAGTYYAIPTSYPITYDLNTGNDAADIVESRYLVAKGLDSLYEPTREKYTFAGWYETSDYTGEEIQNIPANSTGEKTLYAKWEHICSDGHTDDNSDNICDKCGDTLTTGEAFAIYCETDTSLTFYRGSAPEPGDMYNDKIATAVYTGIEEIEPTYVDEVPWYEYYNKITNITVVDRIAPINTAYWFAEMSKCKSLDLGQLDTSNVTNMEYMFCGSYNVPNLDFSNWNTSNVKNMEGMFAETYWLQHPDFTTWDTSNVENMSYMFYNSLWSVTDLDISAFDTTSVENMELMFAYCSTFESILLGSKWDTSNVKDMDKMFYDCKELTIDCSNWNVDNVTSHTSFATITISSGSGYITAPSWK